AIEQELKPGHGVDPGVRSTLGADVLVVFQILLPDDLAAAFALLPQALSAHVPVALFGSCDRFFPFEPSHGQFMISAFLRTMLYEEPSMHRRTILKWVSTLPLYGAIALDALWEKARGATTGNIYSRIGVRPFINARGTWTYLSGSLELPEVRAAKQEAAKYFVDIFELQRAAGKRLAELSGAESGMVTSGAAGAMASAAAGCMAGTDPAKIWQLPDTTGMKNEIVLHGGRSAFDSALRLTGAKLVLARGSQLET